MTRVHLLLAVSAARIGWKSERQSSYQRTRDAFFGNCMEVTRVWTGWKEGDVLEERERERERILDTFVASYLEFPTKEPKTVCRSL